MGKIRIYGSLGDEMKISDIRTQIETAGNDSTIQIDSYGGSVDVAISAINELKASTGLKSVRYVGTSASAATVLASGLGVPVEAYANVSLLIHEARASYEGKASDMADMANYMETLNNTIADIYAKKTGKPAAEMRAIMAENNGEGRWLTAAEALELGFIDVIVDPVAEVKAMYNSNTNPKIKNKMGIFDLFNKKPVATKMQAGVLLSEKPLAVGVKVTTAEALADGSQIDGSFVTADGSQEVTVEAGEVKAITDVTGLTIEEVAAKLAEAEMQIEELKAKLAEYEAAEVDLKAKVTAAAKVTATAAATPKVTVKGEPVIVQKHIAQIMAEKTAEIRNNRKKQ